MQELSLITTNIYDFPRYLFKTPPRVLFLLCVFSLLTAAILFNAGYFFSFSGAVRRSSGGNRASNFSTDDKTERRRAFVFSACFLMLETLGDVCIFIWSGVEMCEKGREREKESEMGGQTYEMIIGRFGV